MPKLESKKTIILITFIATFAVYGTSLFFPKFIFDDDLNIYQNWQVHHFSIKNALHFLKTSLTPIPYITWQIISNISGHFSTWNYRLVNIIFHALNASLVYFLTLRVLNYLQITKRISHFALLTTFIFLFHPVQVESVVWISSLRVLMASFFSLLSCYLLIGHLFAQRDSEQSTGGVSQFIYPLTIILFGLALLCKPTVLPLITIILFIPILKHSIESDQKNSRALAQIKKVAIPVISILVVGLLAVLLHKSEVFSQEPTQIPFIEKINLILLSISTFFLNLFIPFKLGFDYQVNKFVINYLVESNNFYLLSMLAISILFITVALCALKKLRTFGLMTIMILVLLSPHLGLVFQDFQNISTVADRYLYIVLLPFSWLISSIVYFGPIERFNRKTSGILCSIIIVLCFKQISLWHEPKDLLLKSSNYDEVQPPLLLAIGQNYESRGFPLIAKDYYKSALAKDLQSTEALSNLLSLVSKFPNAKDESFIVDFIIRNESRVASEDSIKFSQILLRRKKFKFAQEILKSNIKKGYFLRESQNLLFKISNRSEETLLKSYETLYRYHLALGQFKKAHDYLGLAVKLTNAPKRLLKAHKKHLRNKRGKK